MTDYETLERLKLKYGIPNTTSATQYTPTNHPPMPMHAPTNNTSTGDLHAQLEALRREQAELKRDRAERDRAFAQKLKQEEDECNRADAAFQQKLRDDVKSNLLAQKQANSVRQQPIVTDSDRRIAMLEDKLAALNVKSANDTKQIQALTNDIVKLNELFAQLERRFDDAQEVAPTMDEQQVVKAVIKALKQTQVAKSNHASKPAYKPNHELTHPCQTAECTGKRAEYQTHCKKCHFKLIGTKGSNQ